MHTRLTKEVAKLGEFDQLDLLRKMMEGVTTVDIVMLSPTSNLNGVYSDLGTLIRKLNNSLEKERDPSNSGYAVLTEFEKLPIQERVSNCDKYQTKLLKFFDRNSSALNIFDRIKLQDNTIIYAVDLLIGLLTSSLYNNPAMHTADQLKLLQQLKANPLATVALKNDDTSTAIKRFQLFYRILINSYLSEDKRSFINSLITRLFDFECQYRTHLNKTISLLERMKQDFNNGYVDKLDTKFLFFGSKTPKNVIVLRSIFDKLPNELNLLQNDGDQFVAAIKDITAQAFAIIKDEKSQTFLRKHDLNQFWSKLYDDMQDVINEEGEIPGMIKKYNRRTAN